MRIAMLCLCACSNLLFSQIIADHTCTDITQIPQSAIESAKATLHIAYGHTSHGSQITDGMRGLIEFANNGGRRLTLPDNIFAFNNGGQNSALDLEEGDGYGDGWMDHDCGYYPNWVQETREYLDDASHSDVNVIMWSWCGQASGYSEEQMNTRYLQPMSVLEQEYPDVAFVYMTGHADGSGLSGTLHQRNQQIRSYCEQNGKVLFDFYDIECYDPDGIYYGDRNVDDACNYDGGNWAIGWQNSHTQGIDWYSCGAAHSQPLNANQKAYAVWWLWARLSGWSGPSLDSTAPTVPEGLIANCMSEIRIDLSWQAASDAESGISGYRIYRQGNVIAVTSLTTYSDTTCVPGQSFTYRVSAVNGAGLESDFSDPVTATTPSDTMPPSVPAGLTAIPVSSGNIDLSWEASADNTGVTGYCVYRDGIEIIQTTQTFYSDASLLPATSYSYQVEAVDAAGNPSGMSAAVSATTLDPSQAINSIHLETQEEVDDSFIFSDDPGSNYGNEEYVGQIDRFLIRFNLPPEIMGKQILSAKIGFYVWNQQDYREGDVLKIYCIERSWNENSVTWTNARDTETWQTPGGDYDFDDCITEISHQPGADHTFYPEVDITAVVQKWADGLRSNHGLLIINPGQTQIGFKASEYSEHQRPYLNISYTDKTATRIKATDYAGDFRLDQNYPNPFNPQTHIRFQIPKDTSVELAVFDMRGRKVQTLVSGKMPQGMHDVLFEAGHQPSGIYIIVMKSESFLFVRKVTFLK
ncbi:DNRLRE domain-containing protein [bacterium]|nr:DNRLRE domain-containing protein [bacterium]